MIDIHCHLLPSIDDGAKDLAMSLQMLRIAEGEGINKIIATPHFYRGHYENGYSFVEEEVKKLNEEAKEAGINVEIYPGQEVFVDNYTVSYYKEGAVRGLNNSKYMLLELDPHDFSKDNLDIIYELRILGVKPIIAHPERYSYFKKDFKVLNSLIKEECLFQLDSMSLAGRFGKEAKTTSEKLVKNGIYDFIATDAHSAGRRGPRVSEGGEIFRRIDERAYEKVQANAQSLINNDEIAYTKKEITEKSGIFSFLFR